MNDTTSRLPLLAYDGGCGFCAYWVRYWQRLTGERVRYAPYQEIAADHHSMIRMTENRTKIKTGDLCLIGTFLQKTQCLALLRLVRRLPVKRLRTLIDLQLGAGV